MEELADAFIVLPYGYGTFEEILKFYQMHKLVTIKTMCILNVNNYYDYLVKFYKTV